MEHLKQMYEKQNAQGIQRTFSNEQSIPNT